MLASTFMSMYNLEACRGERKKHKSKKGHHTECNNLAFPPLPSLSSMVDKSNFWVTRGGGWVGRENWMKTITKYKLSVISY